MKVRRIARAICSAAIAFRANRRIHRLEMGDAPRRLSAGSGAMLKLHIFAAMRARNIIPAHRASTGRTFVPVARHPIESRRRYCHHQQSDQRLFHDTSGFRRGLPVHMKILAPVGVAYKIGTTGQYTAPIVPPCASAALISIRAGTIARIAAGSSGAPA